MLTPLIFPPVVGGGAHNRGNPYSCVCLHGDRKPNERKANLQTFKDGNVRFLICTDVAARGIGNVSSLFYVLSNVLNPNASYRAEKLVAYFALSPTFHSLSFTTFILLIKWRSLR